MLFVSVFFYFRALEHPFSYPYDSIPCEEKLKPLEKLPHIYLTIIVQL